MNCSHDLRKKGYIIIMSPNIGSKTMHSNFRQPGNE